MFNYFYLIGLLLCATSVTLAQQPGISGEVAEGKYVLPKRVLEKFSSPTFEVDITNKLIWGCEVAKRNLSDAPPEAQKLLEEKSCVEIVQPTALMAIAMIKSSALVHQRGDYIEEAEHRSLYASYDGNMGLTGCESGCT